MSVELACSDFVELVDDYLDGGLDEARRDSFELHETGCAGCLAYHGQLRRTRDLLAAQRRRPAVGIGALADAAPEPAERVAAFKFLRRGAVGPFSGFRWPVDEWVSGTEPFSACAGAIHACAADDLPYWLQEELWRVELGGPVQRHEHKLAGASGRLVERVTAWDDGRARRFAAACAEEVDRISARLDQSSRDECAAVRDEFLSYADFAAAPALATLSSYLCGRVDGEGAADAERARQAAWLAAELGLGSASAEA